MRGSRLARFDVVPQTRFDAVPPDERERIEELKRQFKRERLARKQRLAEAEITGEEGERPVDSIRGIDRAITAPEGRDSPSLTETLRHKETRDARRLLSLVEQMR